ncbi:MAG: bifunctional 5,6,7,8-tetrahydromethanopterin hydro-lyase/3-hexulose-6-phosphate synthase [Methanocellales archaeon]|nr:bifunctional 5,6,7,8-tetrahydromethanopterin hydro-lyase/3-hexulose-6-phosphate synthase [Methanocellales archaeon]MDD3291186.1 bifunctional 5,6,7,8-tetrahydromethanopterin hydro-lyase/3-hexulose-6-phosphate synthase [Methanocellales archaeon]MDD5235286.1 bifunctional 5,6,7,8-tetrahydromethanopterin hydro-lyase/3-hexulose-6-phosphate synthase [Methanocellales archaeon]MDD5484558.1 bifunctional 5,6,7,8-tetrahydromethanopterin hydro-lyase/3-hexulose-6-phosphate synthase [Methanocellales archaeo
MYLLGEALIGEEPEIAHIDLVIGDKNGPVGMAFVNAMSHMSAGHTPLLAVIRPNLPTKPSTLVVPKVTVQNLEQAAQVFGPAQTAVAKAVADAVEEGLIPKDKAEELVLIVSVFIHPKAEDYGKIYRYNYGATKLAIQRAMEGFPSVDKIIYEKDRSIHPIMGFKIVKLWDPPYLQVALDIPSIESTKKVLEELPESDHLILEAGTPLIKRYGLDIIQKMREIRRDAFIVADLKTLDVGNLEARMAADATADALVVSGLAPPATIEKVITEARKTGICSVIDMLNVGDPKGLLERLTVMPDVVELHRAIDVESKEIKHAWSDIKGIKLLSDKMLVAVAGGIVADNAKEAIKSGADILIVGRAITKAKDIEGMARRFLELMKEEIDQFRVMTDF